MIENSNMIVVQEGNKIHLFNAQDILMIKAERYYVNIHCIDKKVLIRITLKKLAGQLPINFIRISKSLVMNIYYIRRVDELKSTLTLHTAQGLELQVTQKYKEQFKERIKSVFPSLQEIHAL